MKKLRDRVSGKPSSESDASTTTLGSLAVVNGETTLFDALLHPIRTLAIGGRGVVIDDAGTRAYASGGLYIDVANVATGNNIGSIPTFDDLNVSFAGGQMALSPDGSTIVVATPHGVAVVQTRPL